jgi:dihydroflavonol-4-reductase
VADERTPSPLDVVAKWPYYRSKLFAEQAALEVADLEVVVLSPSLLLGPGDERGTAVRAVQYLLDGEVPAAPPGGICFVDVRDVAEAACSALERGSPGSRYLLGAANWSFAEFYERLARIAEVPAPSLRLPKVTRRVLEFLPKAAPAAFRSGPFAAFGRVGREDLEFGCYWWWVDSSRARDELGFEPRDPGGTLADTVHDLRSRPVA